MRAEYHPLQALLLSVAGCVNRHQQHVIAYLVEENRVLKEQFDGKVPRLNDDQRRRLASKAKLLGRKMLNKVATIVTPDTLIRWHKRLIAAKWTYVAKRVGRPGLMGAIKALIVRFALENPSWGYCRIQGELKDVGHQVASTTIANVLNENGIKPAPDRPSSWRTFLQSHWGEFAATDFFTTEVWTPRGLVTFYTLFVIDLKSRRVHIAGITTKPDSEFMAQVARNLTDVADGFLLRHRFLICDRDTKFVDQDGAPVVGAFIQRTPAKRAGYPQGVSSWDEDGQAMPHIARTYTTDTEGRFFEEGLPPGPQTLRLRVSPWVVVDHSFEMPIEGHEDIEFVVPPHGYVEGQLSLSEGAEVTDLTLRFSGPSCEDTRGSFGDPFEGGEIGPSGSFRFGPLPPGELQASAVFVIPSGSGTTSERSEQLGSVVVEAGRVTSANWSIRDIYPGSARVALTVDGKDMTGVRPTLGRHPDEIVRSGPMRADEAGWRTMLGLEPGTWYVGVVGANSAWHWVRPEPLGIEPRAAVDVELKLDLIRQKVRVLDAESGRPLADSDVVAWTGPLGWMACSTCARTDAEGIVAFRLPPGEVRFCRLPSDYVVTKLEGLKGELEDNDALVVDWEAAEQDLVLRLPQRGSK